MVEQWYILLNLVAKNIFLILVASVFSTYQAQITLFIRKRQTTDGVKTFMKQELAQHSRSDSTEF